MRITDDITYTTYPGNISLYLRANAERFPDKPALLHPTLITYGELEKEVDHCAYGLRRAGIDPGTRTILMVPVNKEFLVITFALLRIGAIPVMIDPGMGIMAMIKALSDVKAEAFIGIPKAHLLRLIRPSVFRSVRSAVYSGFHLKGISKRLKIHYDDSGKKYPVYNAYPDEAAAIFFTSGSTGPAKGVVYTTGILSRQIQVTRSHFRIREDDIDLCTSHLLGLFAICHGISSVIADINMKKPASLDPARIIQNILDYNCTQMFGSPMVLTKLSEYGIRKNVTLESLKRIISAGAPVHRTILDSFSRLLAVDAEIHTPYGATEALPVSDIMSSEIMHFDHSGGENENGICVGYPLAELTVRIISITDGEIPVWTKEIEVQVNTVGEIAVRGPWVTTTYFMKPLADRLAKINDPDGNGIWHRMGDLGRIDENGILWYYGRKSQRVITPEGTLLTIPCEAVFNKHRDVLRSALVGVPGNQPGQMRPVICIQLKKGSQRSGRLIQELKALAAGNMLTISINDILFFKEFPVDPRHNAKIIREKLAECAKRQLL